MTDNSRLPGDMQTILISDIHPNYHALQAVLHKYRNADAVWRLGDIMEYGPCPARSPEFQDGSTRI